MLRSLVSRTHSLGPARVSVVAPPLTLLQCRFVGRKDLTRPWDQKPNKQPMLSVILLKDYAGVGRQYEEVRVKRGLVRNILIPEKVAVYANYVTRTQYNSTLVAEGKKSRQRRKPEEVVVPEGAFICTQDTSRSVPYWFLRKWYRVVILHEEGPICYYPRHVSHAYYANHYYHLPISHIYMKAPIMSYGEHLLPVKVYKPDEKKYYQVGIIVHVMRRKEVEDVKGITARREEERRAQLQMEMEPIVTGGAVERMEELSMSRHAVLEERRELRRKRIEEIRQEKGLLSHPTGSQGGSTDLVDEFADLDFGSGEGGEGMPLKDIEGLDWDNN